MSKIIPYRGFSIVLDKSLGGFSTTTIYSGTRCEGNPGILQVSEQPWTVFKAMNFIDKRWFGVHERQSTIEEYEVKA